MKASYDIETWKDSGGLYAICIVGDLQFLLDSNYPDTLNVYKKDDNMEFLPDNMIEILSVSKMIHDELDLYTDMIHEMLNNETNEQIIQDLENCFVQALKEKSCRDMVHYGKLIARIDFDETEEFKTYRIYLDSKTGLIYRITMKNGLYLNLKVIDMENLSYLILNNKEYLSYLDLTHLKEVI